MKVYVVALQCRPVTIPLLYLNLPLQLLLDLIHCIESRDIDQCQLSRKTTSSIVLDLVNMLPPQGMHLCSTLLPTYFLSRVQRCV